MLQKLVLDGRKFRQSGKSAALAKLVKKGTSMWKKGKSRVVVFTHHAHTLHELEKQLVALGLGKQVAVLRAGQQSSNRIALRGFVSDPPATPVLLTTDEAAAGLEFTNADTLVNYDLPWNPVQLEQRLERLDCVGQESGRITVHNLSLEDSGEYEILQRLYTKLNLFECRAGKAAELVQACGYHDGTAFEEAIGRIVVAASAREDFEGPLMEMLKTRKQSGKVIRDRRKATGAALSGLDAMPASDTEEHMPLEVATPQVRLAEILTACLEQLGQGWERKTDGRLVLRSSQGPREIVLPRQETRLLGGQGDAAQRWVFAPGSRAWNEVAGPYRDGASFFLHDARDLEMAAVKAVLRKRFEEHGLVVEQVDDLERRACFAGVFTFRLIAETGAERVERMIEVEVVDQDHALDGLHRDLKNLPGGNPISSLAREHWEEFAPAFREAANRVRTQAEEDESTARFGSRHRKRAEAEARKLAATTGLDATKLAGSHLWRALENHLEDAEAVATLRDRYLPRVRVEPFGFKGVLYDVATVGFQVRHPEQTAAWALQTECVPLSGVLTGELPLPAPGSAPSEMWACSSGHLVPKENIRTCAAEGCEVGACEKHLQEAGTVLLPCDTCGELGCPDHAHRCSGCSKGLCASHVEHLHEGGEPVCHDCGVQLEDGRWFLGGDLQESAVSGRQGLRSEMVQSDTSGRWAFRDEAVLCPVTERMLLQDETAVDESTGERVAADQVERSEVSGAWARKDSMVHSDWSGRACLRDEAVRCELTDETLLPDEVETCVRSGKTVRRDRMFTDPTTGERCLEEYTVVSAVSGTRTMPENMSKCARSGQPALAEELSECTECHALILPEEGVTCVDSGRFGCPDHLVTCDASGKQVFPEALGRCEVSNRTVRKALLETCPETGRKALAELFVECEASGARVLKDALALCSVTGKRVQRGMLESCAVTGRKALGSELGTCQVSGKRVLPELLIECAESGVKFLASEAQKCAETGALCAPEGLAECAETGRVVRRSLLATDDHSGVLVLERLLKTCKRTNKQTVASNLGTCMASGLRVLESELAECEETDRPVLPDHLATCEESGRKVHPDQLVTCHETKRQILKRLAERCASTGLAAAPGVLQECEVTHKKVLPGQLAVDGLTGQKVLADMLVECETAGCSTMPVNLVRSSVSGKDVPQRDATRCAISDAWALADELGTCAVTGKRVLPTLLAECEVTGDTVLKEELETCASTGKMVRRDRLETCPRSGQRVLGEHLVASQLTGEIGLRSLLIPCEFSRKRVFPDELVVSQLSGKSLRRDRATKCAASGRVLDISETKACICCDQAVGNDLLEDECCPTCLRLLGAREGHQLAEADLAKVQRSHPKVRKAEALETASCLYLFTPKRGFGSSKSAWLLVFRRVEDGLEVVKELALSGEMLKALAAAAKDGSGSLGDVTIQGGDEG